MSIGKITVRLNDVHWRFIEG